MPRPPQAVIDYTYLQDGKVDHADYRNGVRTAYAYDGRGMTQVVDHYRISGSQDLSWRQYTRDERDRIISFQKGTSGYNPMENGRGDRFRYDEEGQLVEGWYNAADPANAGDGAWRYDGFNYDALGNRRSWDFVASKGQWLNFTRKDDGLNEYRGWMPFSMINYDDDIGGSWGAPSQANGVIMQEGNITGGYNALNQPMLITSNAVAPNWMFFGYDPLGRCVKRWLAPSPSDGSLVPPPDSNPATYFYYEGWNLIQEGTSYANASRNYIHGARVDEVVKQITPNNWWERYFQYDARGHCTLQTDAGGNIVEQYEYDAFGQPYFYDGSGTNIGYSPWGNRFLFTGREYMSELKLYDYRNRLYQPELGRFMQPDPNEFGAGDYNLYRYCHNDPVNRSDPMGLDSGERLSPKDLVRLREIKFTIPLGSNLKQWVPTGRMVTMTKGLFTKLMDGMIKDHADRTQTVYKNGSHSDVSKGHLLANNSHGVFERSRRQEFIPYDGHSDVAIFLHVHSVWNGATPFPNPVEDWATVKSWQRPMLFGSEPLYGRGIGMLITPNGNHDPSETAIDLNR